MNKSILLQKQVKDNSEDLQNEFFDMKHWEEQMKRKDEELRKEASGEVVLPPIRSKNKKKVKTTEPRQTENTNRPKRIKSYDYSQWDKFDVEKACKEVDKKDESENSDEETMSKEELEKAHEIATKHKNEGNAFVQQQEWVKAIGCYNQAIKAFPYDAIFYANRALCHLKLDNLHSAESDCSAAIQLDEAYVKAYHRRATARMELKQYKEAKQDIEKVLKIDPANKEAKSLLAQIEKKIERSKPIIISGEDLTTDEPIEKKIAKKLCSNAKPSEKPKSPSEDKISDTKLKDTKPEQKDKRIPDWLPEKNDVSIIKPVDIPVHQRSKSIGKRVPVEEVEFEGAQSSIQTHEIPSDVKQKIEPIKATENNIVKESKTQSENDVKNNVATSETDPESLSVPRTAAQFLMEWRRHRSSSFRYKYLKQLTPSSLPKLFQDSLESDIFGEIVSVLGAEFRNNQEPVFQYLENLSKVKRFNALIMFLNNKNKEDLKSLFEYCKTAENISEEDITKLCEKYEI